MVMNCDKQIHTRECVCDMYPSSSLQMVMNCAARTEAHTQEKEGKQAQMLQTGRQTGRQAGSINTHKDTRAHGRLALVNGDRPARQ